MKKSLMFSLLGVTTVVTANAQVPQKPNILWVMAEDMGHDLECYGMKAVKTPVLNAMAAEGLMYNQAICANPISSPNRSAMMTGVHQTNTNSHNHRSNRDTPIDTQFKPFTYYLRQNGYKAILGNKEVMGLGRKIDCNFKTEALGEWDGVNNFGLFDKYDEFTAADQPFFAQIQLVVTHRGDWWNKVRSESKHPIDPAAVELPPFMEDHPKIREEFATYLDQVEYMDNEMGLLLEQLKKEGILDNTIIIFIGDNGRCDVRGKGYLYEPGIKIPMIAWGKGIKQGVVDDIVSVVDITATVLDLAGVEVPDYYQGEPLINKKNGKPIDIKRDCYYSARDTWDEIAECVRSVTTTEYKYIRNYFPEIPWDAHQQYLDFYRPAIHVMRGLKAEGKLSPEASLFMADKKPKEELYDLRKDPFELNNLAADPKYKKVLASMSKRMDKWQEENGDMGVADRNNRHPEPRPLAREYAQQYDPEGWQFLVDGGIGEKFKFYMGETKKLAAKQAKEAKK